MNNKVISEIDVNHINIIRRNVSRFLKECAEEYDKGGVLLDIAPQIHEGATPYFKKSSVLTLDIDSNSGADFIADICADNSKLIKDNSFDYIVCTEVLEHTLNPFSAVSEIKRILRKNGLFFLSVPFNLRIHGPLPDCWRFTEHGLRALLKEFEIIKIEEVESKERWLMPVHYTIIARNN